MPDQHLTINDPVYGFINVPRGLLCRVIAHPLFQRLERIRQLGMAPFVYPGAHHTRKQHVIGAFHLTQTALATLMRKGHFIFDSEAEAMPYRGELSYQLQDLLRRNGMRAQLAVQGDRYLLIVQGHYHVLRLVLQLKYQAESEDSQTCNAEWGSLPVTLPSN